MQGGTDMSEDGAGTVGPPEIRSSRKMLCPRAGGTEGAGGVPLTPGPESPVEAGAEQEGGKYPGFSPPTSQSNSSASHWLDPKGSQPERKSGKCSPQGQDG